jgi:hypothetical protein
VYKHLQIVWGKSHLLNSIERGNTCWRDVKIIQIGYLIYEWYVLTSSFLFPSISLFSHSTVHGERPLFVVRWRADNSNETYTVTQDTKTHPKT